MNTKELTALLNANIEIVPDQPKPMTANDYNETMDKFANKLNDMFKSLEQSKTTEIKDTETNDNKQQL